MLVRPMLLHRMALVSVRLFCKNLGNLQEFFGQMVYRPPHPPEKNCPYTYVCLHQLVLIIVDDICVARSVKILLREFQEETSNKPKKKTM